MPSTTATPPTTSARTSASPPPASGKVTAVVEGHVVFALAGTNYELKLVAPNYTGPVGKPVKGVIRVKPRKVWTVPSGGNFITPIFGTPRIIQGQVRALDRRWLVIHAGGPIWVNLPDNDTVYDLATGPIRVGGLINVTALPGATLKLAK